MPTNSEERVSPLSGVQEQHLLGKFSRWPIWEALNNVSETALPKWQYPTEPSLKKRGGSAVWEYSLPHHFKSVKIEEKRKITNGKIGGRFFRAKSNANSVRVSTDISLNGRSITELQNTSDSNEKILLRRSKLKAVAQQREDMFRVTVLWESICAALSVAYYVWNRYSCHVGGSTEEEYLKYLAPFFDAVGIDIERVWKIAFNAPYFGEGKAGKAARLFDPYRRKASESITGKLSKRERERRKAEAEANAMLFTNSLEAHLTGIPVAKKNSKVKQKSNTKRTKPRVSGGKKERE